MAFCFVVRVCSLYRVCAWRCVMCDSVRLLLLE